MIDPKPSGPLPVDEALPGIHQALRTRGAVVVVAPPGTGKTTRLPPALIHLTWFEGACLVLEPRRVAARAAARHVAHELGTQLGEKVGYQVRFDRRVSPASRLVYVTEGILTARLQQDPTLEGVGAVVLDEFHERSLDADLALAFLQEIRRELRPDLKIVVLSATLDPEPVRDYLGAEVFRLEASPHPVAVEYLSRRDPSPLPILAAAGVRRIWGRRPGGTGDVLVFLPGAAELRATARELEGWARQRGALLAFLHGDLPAPQQDRALRVADRPRVILSTNVAETSVTVEGVVAVVDSGLAKVLRHDPSSGLDRLETEAVSLASAAQRAGRAGRNGPGVVLRLWTEHDERGRVPELPPEIARADLAHVLLDVVGWGYRDPMAFPWFQSPDHPRVEAALRLLRRLGALDTHGDLTPDGDVLRRLPAHPRLGRILLAATRAGFPKAGARMAALLSERDLLSTGRAFGRRQEAPTTSSDVLHRLDLLERAAEVHFDSGASRDLGLDPGTARSVWRSAAQMEALATRLPGPVTNARAPDESELLHAIMAGYPDRVARRRREGVDRFVLASGRGAVLDRESGVRHDEFVVAVRLEAGRRGARAEDRIRWASRVERHWLEPLEARTDTSFDPDRGCVVAREGFYYDDLCVSERPADPDPEVAHRLLVKEAMRDPESTLQPGPSASALLARCRFLARVRPELGLPSWGPADWERLLTELAWGKRCLEDLRKTNLLWGLRRRLTASQRAALDREAPERIQVPSGSLLPIRYTEEGLPVLAVKIQEMFGSTDGPRLAGGRVPVLLHLLGPHGRPLQVTSDLSSFWENGYAEVRKEMRGRYPKHRWPEDPRAAVPSSRTTKS